MDQRICIKFCVKNKIKCADAFRMLTVAYGEATLDRSNVYRWYKMFSEGREDVNDEERAGRPSTSTTDENIDEVKKIVLANRRITVREVAEDLNISIGSCHSIFTNDLGMRRVAAKFVFSDALTERIFPDTPPQSSESSHPISPRRSPSPTNSTDSVEFLEEILPPPPRSYFRILESDTFESLISQFPRVTTASIPQGAYTIGPHYFDSQELRKAITGQASTSSIPVFLPNSTHAILVPVKFFNNLFPSFSVSILEIC
ncbi:hypothetical protein ALC56_01346 [Trachymyrmex septentrionalis]|uniref:Mos1 transposase HTH domain-containing protein n=1 Tax=Trachymyrmex septentrionalis TaxID=34720 RepID=A0A151K0Q5_9HYME|nr:hypothetical protein ALC56_01346 [Trachymyrmex septentrionalis]